MREGLSPREGLTVFGPPAEAAYTFLARTPPQSRPLRESCDLLRVVLDLTLEPRAHVRSDYAESVNAR